MITTEQIRAARAMLHLGQKELAEKAEVSVATYNNIERGAQTDPKLSTINSIQQAFAAHTLRAYPRARRNHHP